MSTNRIKKYTLKEYFEIEKTSDIRHEFVYGEIFAMVGASRSHNRIASAINTRLYMQFLNTTCESFMSETRTRVNNDLYYYPDIVVACNPEFEVIEGVDNLINPVLIVEVLSRSTARFDRDTKFREYQQIGSLRYYLLVSQNEVDTTLFTRQDNNWTNQNYNNLADAIELPTINARLNIRDIYLRVQFQQG